MGFLEVPEGTRTSEAPRAVTGFLWPFWLPKPTRSLKSVPTETRRLEEKADHAPAMMTPALGVPFQ